TGIDENQRSLRIAARSPCQFSFPRSWRISPCRLKRRRVRRPRSTASRLVFRPVARSVSRISRSSITMFVRMDVYSQLRLYTSSRRGTRVLDHADIPQIPVLFSVVQTVAHYELVGDLKPDVAHVYGTQPAFRLVQKRGDADGPRLPLIQHVHQVI